MSKIFIEDFIFQPARKTLAEWQSENPVLRDGEFGVVSDGTETEWLKVGDGVTAWNSLPYKKGPKGEQGIKGDKGDKGDTGATGSQGIQGEKGDKGDKGDAFTYADFTPEQLAGLKGEKGDKGDKGDTGATGPQGPQGEKGDTGPQGPPGKTPETDQTYNPESANAQSGIAVAQAVDTCSPAIVTASDTGKALSIPDSSESVIRGLTGYGESTQDGTPTPDSPVEIESIENPVISVYGKNLIKFPYRAITNPVNGITFTVNDDGTVIANGTATADASITLQTGTTIKANNTTFAVSGCPEGGGSSKYYLRVSMGGIALQDTGSGYVGTIASNISNEYIQIMIRQGVTADNLVFKPQCEIGTTVTAYEPYIEPQTVTIPYTFRGLKNTTTGQWSARDELRVADGKVEIVRNIKSLTITAENSDSYSFLSGNISGDICRMSSYKNGPKPLFNDMTQDASVNYVLCNLFEHYKGLQATAGYEGISGTTYTGNIYINVSLTRIGLEPDTTVGDAGIRAAFWNWIKDKGCEIDYILAEPVVEDITATEAGQALLALATNYPTTSVISDIDLNLTYRADTKNYIDNKIAALTALTLEG